MRIARTHIWEAGLSGTPARYSFGIGVAAVSCAVVEWEALLRKRWEFASDRLPSGREETGFKQWNARQNVVKKVKKKKKKIRIRCKEFRGDQNSFQLEGVSPSLICPFNQYLRGVS